MPEITIHEVFSVDIQVDAEYPEQTRVRPSGVYCDTEDEALDAIRRALRLLPAKRTVVMVSREWVDHLDNEEDSDLADWPSPRHIVNGPMTAEDL